MNSAGSGRVEDSKYRRDISVRFKLLFHCCKTSCEYSEGYSFLFFCGGGLFLCFDFSFVFLANLGFFFFSCNKTKSFFH